VRRIAVLAGCAVLAAASASLGEAAHVVLLGRSVDGRPITAIEVGNPAGTRVLVVGCIHGSEPAGIAIARLLEHASPNGVDLWIVPVLNPDGLAANTRANAHGVDLNRNFPWHWQPLAGGSDSGPHPLSEPESRIAYRLIERLKPQISIWFHQHLRAVDDSQGSVSLERRFAHLVGLPARPLIDYPGSVTGWENQLLAGSTAFVVELPAGRLRPAQVSRYARAVLAIA
jgi:protein MpaA